MKYRSLKWFIRMLNPHAKKAGEWVNSTMENSPSSGFEYVQSDAMILLFPATFT